LVYKVVWPHAREFIQSYKGRRRGPIGPRPGDRYPDALLADEMVVLLEDAQDVWVSCLRHEKWKLDLRAVRHRLAQRQVTGNPQRYGSKAPK
jgi:hypothetical protein